MIKATFEQRAEWASSILHLRNQEGFTQKQLAKKAKVSVSAIQKLERGVEGGRAMFLHLFEVMNPPIPLHPKRKAGK